MDSGLLVLRIIVGLALAAHGAQKLFGWFDGPGLAGLHGFMGHLRFRPARLWSLVAIAGELGGGLGFAAGFLSPLPALGMIGAMAVAATVHWPNGFFAQKGGIELTVLYAAAASAAAISGPGRFSLDSAIGLSLPEPLTGLVAAAATVVTVAAALAIRTPARRVAQPDESQRQAA